MSHANTNESASTAGDREQRSPSVFGACQTSQVNQNGHLPLGCICGEEEVEVGIKVTKDSRLVRAMMHHAGYKYNPDLSEQCIWQKHGVLQPALAHLELVLCQCPLVMLLRRHFLECGCHSESWICYPRGEYHWCTAGWMPPMSDGDKEYKRRPSTGTVLRISWASDVLLSVFNGSISILGKTARMSHVPVINRSDPTC